ncbi:hypothetical protein [Limnohabitans sp.]|uniref:hypothetical protein n=1 Tax=Limnohabitans sp. TaxID=1907725 RepID=UPI0039BD651B|nr:hypothetical protein [Comamonadaceae bacterium]
MHNAPPVAFPVGRFVWGRVLLWAAATLSAAGLIGWQMHSQAATWLVACAWGFWWLCWVATAAWAPRQHASGGNLFWTGEAWFWQAEHALSAPAQAVRLTVGLDTGSGLLMWVQHVDDQGRAMGPLTSAWLQSDAMPSKWHGFRCAVYSRPKVPGVKKDPGVGSL